MNKTHFEVIEIQKATLTVDVSMVTQDIIWFNATEVAKAFGKMPKDWLKNQDTIDYIEALASEEHPGKENPPFENYVRVKKGGRYQGTWLHASLRIPFARWCSALFAVRLDKWVVKRLSEERTKQQARLAARTGYLPMSKAVLETHDPIKFYHFSNEADLINRIVLGVTSKQFKTAHGIDNVRDALSAAQLHWIEKLQRINTGLIEVGMDFQARKLMLSDHYNHKMLLEAA